MIYYIKRLTLMTFTAAVLMITSCTDSKVTAEEETQVKMMDSTSEVIKDTTAKLEDQTKKVEEDLEKLDKEFEDTK
jgi:septal ring factor EnvC (AmiA/AmiB activator)